MAGRMQKTYDAQALRQSCYPIGRIAFLGTDAAVAEDMANFRRYADGEINLEELCRRVAWSNFLEKYYRDGIVPPSMMLNELRICGWLVE